MLGKLTKHEFKAMGRTLLPVYAATVIMGLLSAVFSRGMFVRDRADSSFFNIITVLMIVLYVVLITAEIILSLAASILRFKRNLLGSEGYLMNVLPVEARDNIFAKLISAAVYQILSFFVALISVTIFIMVSSAGENLHFNEFWAGICKLVDMLGGPGVVALYSIEGIIFCIISLLSTNTMFYASLAVGHSFNSKKMFKSVCAFIAFYLVSQTINSALIKLAYTIDIFKMTFSSSAYSAQPHMIALILLETFYFAAYFSIANYFLKNKLNLQ